MTKKTIPRKESFSFNPTEDERRIIADNCPSLPDNQARYDAANAAWVDPGPKIKTPSRSRQLVAATAVSEVDQEIERLAEEARQKVLDAYSQPEEKSRLKARLLMRPYIDALTEIDQRIQDANKHLADLKSTRTQKIEEVNAKARELSIEEPYIASRFQNRKGKLSREVFLAAIEEHGAASTKQVAIKCGISGLTRIGQFYKKHLTSEVSRSISGKSFIYSLKSKRAV